MSRLLAALALSAVLTACATTPVTVDEARPGIVTAFGQPGDTTGVVIVKRDQGLLGSGCDFRILVDGQEAGRVSAGEMITLHVPAGRRLVGADSTSICGAGRHPVETEATIVAGATQMFRVKLRGDGLSGDGRIEIEPTSF